MSRERRPVIITCSISGVVANRDQCPAIPYTRRSTRRRRAARSTRAASMIHIHARKAGRHAAYEVEDFRAITQAILAEVDDGDHQLLDGRDRRLAGEADRVPARAQTRRRRAEHGLDELREVLARAQGVRLPDGLREQLRDDRSSCSGDERAGHQARARVLRPRPRRQPRPADRHGRAERAAADRLRDGRRRRHPPERAQPRAHGRERAGRAGRPEQLGRDRHLARPVDADRRGARRSAARCASAWRTTSTCPTARWRAPTAS